MSSLSTVEVIRLRRTRGLVVLTISLGLALLTSCGSEGTTSSSVLSAAPTTTVVNGYEMLSPAAADELLRSPPAGLVILDVRTPPEFAAGHIASAVDVDLAGATFETDVANLDPKAPYFVYCHTGRRSADAVAYLRQHGFSSVYELEGGISAWEAAGLPVVTG
jgi:phage shock protein E